MTVADALTWLFVPGNRSDRFAKALASGADEVIIDLQDAVSVEHKDEARTQVRRWFGTAAAHTAGAWVRVNGIGSTWHDTDVELVREIADRGVRGVMLPIAQDVADVTELVRRLQGLPLVLLLETAQGIAEARQLARVDGVGRLAFGSIDFSLDVGCEETDEALLLARSEVVLASRLGALPAPIDGVSVDIRDEAAVENAARHSRRLGFGGKLLIHPAQAAPARRGFAPSAEAVQWARRVLEAVRDDGTAVQVAGEMVDTPVITRAHRIIAAAEAAQ